MWKHLPRFGPTHVQLATLGTAAVVLAAVAVASTAEGLAAQRALVEAIALVARTLVYSGTFVAVGGALFVTAVHDGHVEEAAKLRFAVRVAAAIGAAASVVSLPVQVAVLTGAGLRGLGDAHTLGAVVASPFGMAGLVRVAGLAGVAWAVAWAVARPRVGASAAAAGGVLVVAAFLVTGHAATAEPRWLAAAATAVHTAGAAVWIGGLVGLAVVLRSRRRSGDAVGGARIIGRFSTVAGISIAALVPTGTALGVVAVGGLDGLAGSGYGRALLLKVALVAGVVGIGAYNRWCLVPAITRDAVRPWRRLTATVRWELVGLLGVIVATGVLGRMAPPT